MTGPADDDNRARYRSLGFETLREDDLALRSSKAVGFRHVRDFIEDGELKELLSLSRDEAVSCQSAFR
jgi:hypothetical protein